MKPDVEARVRRLEDEAAVRDLAARFSDCADVRDFDGFADLRSAHVFPLAAAGSGVVRDGKDPA